MKKIPGLLVAVVLLFADLTECELEEHDGKCDFLFVECEAVCEFTCSRDPSLTHVKHLAAHGEIIKSVPWSNLHHEDHQQIDRAIHKPTLLGRLYSIHDALLPEHGSEHSGRGEFVSRFLEHAQIAKSDPELFSWPCVDHCRYECMHRAASRRAGQSRPVVKYFGKWPFRRVFICQEILSTIFSVANGIPYVVWLFSGTARKSTPMYKLYTIVLILMWISSALFHCRDCVTTMHLDYFFAFGGILTNFAVAVDNVFFESANRGFRKFLARLVQTLIFAVWAGHSWYMAFVNFDFDWNMTLAVSFGSLGTGLWTYWYWQQRKLRPHAWLILPGTLGLFPFLILFELNDFPPGPLGLADAHSFWHLSTVAMSATWALFMYRETLFARRSRKQLSEKQV